MAGWRVIAGRNTPGRCHNLIYAIVLKEIDRLASSQYRIGLAQPKPGGAVTASEVDDRGNTPRRASVNELFDGKHMLLGPLEQANNLVGELPTGSVDRGIP